MSYYNVDAILTETQKIPCTFQLDVPGLGYLDGNAGGMIKAGTTIELPMWLGVMLAVSAGKTPGSPQLVTLNFPTPLQQRVINALKADPRTVDLRAQAPHYYALSARIMELFDDQDVLNTLIDTFKARALEVADQAHNPRGALGDGADFLRGLEETERHLFKAAHEGPKAVKAWTKDLKKNT